jgi:uncharacterized membrane protein
VYVDAGGVTHGFARNRRGDVTTVDVDGAIATIAFDNNDRGEIVGLYIDAAGVVHGFRRGPAGDTTTIDVPDMAQTRLRGINDDGQIVIDSVDNQVRHHGWLYEAGEFTEITLRGVPTGSLAVDINDDGEIIGNVL